VEDSNTLFPVLS